MEQLVEHVGLPVPLMQGLLVGIWLLAVGLVAEGVRQRTTASAEITRKIVHIGAGNAILLAWWLHLPAWIGIAASVIFSGVALLSYRLPILPGINSVGRPSLGTFFYAVSIGVLIGVFWPQQQAEFAVLGILTMTWGDGLAALIGQAAGRHRYRIWGMEKSWEGSGTMGMVTFCVCASTLGAVHGFSVWVFGIAAVVAIAATALEAFSRLGIDNLTVPIGSAVLAWGLTQWWLA